MAYQNPNKQQPQKYAGSYNNKSVQSEPMKPQGGKSTPDASTKVAADKDIVVVDKEGQIIKGDNNYSLRAGSIWSREDGTGSIVFDAEGLKYLLDNPGTKAKIFHRKKKEA